MTMIRIRHKQIGNGEPCFIIAEAGVNHNGSFTRAKQLIDIAKQAGADAVKFQSYKTEKLVTRKANLAEYQKKSTQAESQFQMLKRFELSDIEFKQLAEYCDDQNIIFLSTPFDLDSVDTLHRLNVPAYKISSGDLTNVLLLQKIASKQLPVILSTGMGTLGEIEDAIRVIKQEGVTELAILHCISSYPAPLESMNLKMIKTLQVAFKTIVGLSDHTQGSLAAVSAITLGANIIEKHFTADKSLPGPDHQASLSPAELSSYIKTIRKIETALGDGIKKVEHVEIDVKKAARRSIAAATNIQAGEIITPEMLTLKRPEVGILPKYLEIVIGSRAARNIKADDILYWNMIELENPKT